MPYPRIYNLYSSIAERSSAVISTGGCAILGANITNTASEDRFIQLFDRATLPTTGIKPIISIPVYRLNGYTEFNEDTLGYDGLVFDIGLCWGLSTAAASFQPAAATDGIITIRWK